MSEMCVVLTTTGSDDEARGIGRSLVEARLAACVQRLPIASVYEWRAGIEEAPEVLLLIKTTVERYAEVESWLRGHHPYEVPEILMLRAERTSLPYLEWATAATSGPPG
jgi:periplasmic divalent cation tolerance protein